MASLTFDLFGDPITLRVTKTEYELGGLAIQLWYDGEGYWEEWATLTKFFYPVKDGFAYLDANNCRREVAVLLEAGHAKVAGRPFVSGFCEYPFVEFDHEWLASLQTSQEFFGVINE